MKVGSLFSGIGGFDLGLERAGFEIAWQVEIDDYCNKVLAKHWPNVKRYGDVKDVAFAPCGKSWEQTQQERGQDTCRGSEKVCSNCLEWVDIICGGFPCQPFSHAGRRRGKADDRYLWPEMLRIISEVRPRWVLGENVAGIKSMVFPDSQTEVGDKADIPQDEVLEYSNILSGILDDLERIGYSVQTFCVPACAIGAPHRRDRVWIVAHSERERNRYEQTCQGDSRIQLHSERWQGMGMQFDNGSQDVADTIQQGSQRYWGLQKCTKKFSIGKRSRTIGSEWIVEPNVCGVVDGLSQRIHGGRLDASKRMDSQQKRIDEGILRDLWEQTIAGSSPQGQHSDEQFSRKLADSLRCLPHEMALGEREASMEATRIMSGMRQASQEIGLLRNPQQSIQEAWESASDQEKDWIIMATCRGQLVSEWPGVPRVASRVKERVNRLKCLGNAVVPQIVEVIGRAIMEIENDR